MLSNGMSEKRQAIMMAAGFGSRVGEITKAIPKALIPINGKPMIEQNIECMIDAGLSRLVMMVGYKREAFQYLVEKYKDKIEIVQVYNPKYQDYNTFSTIYYASDYFDRDSFFTTADIYLTENIYKKYGWKDTDALTYGFYLHKQVKNLSKPDWIATLGKDEVGKYIISVDKNGTNGSMYSGITYWPVNELKFISGLLHNADWNDPSLKTKYWDELLFPIFDSHHIHVRHMESEFEILEVDDEEDLRFLKKYVGDPVSVEDLKRSLYLL